MARRDDIGEVISGLEEIAERSPLMTAAAVLILKNELARVAGPGGSRELLFEERFVLPGRSLVGWKRCWDWLLGEDSAEFRDRCDRAFWERVVPVVESEFGELAELVMNTVNEAVINYAEYSFKRWAVGRRVTLQLFRTEGELAYAIIRPGGGRLARFDPLDLKEKSADALLNRKRGWGHTILMRRALFVSFDRSPRMRGMMIVLGPDGDDDGDDRGGGREA